MTQIRVLVAEDQPRVVEMAMAFLRGTPYGEAIGADAGHAAAMVERCLGRDDAAIFVAEDESGVFGFVAGLKFDHPYSGKPIVTELAWWVDPEKRGTAGLRLLKALEEWAKANGAQAIQMIAPAWSSVSEVYERRGYRRIETLYQRGV